MLQKRKREVSAIVRYVCSVSDSSFLCRIPGSLVMFTGIGRVVLVSHSKRCSLVMFTGIDIIRTGSRCSVTRVAEHAVD